MIELSSEDKLKLGSIKDKIFGDPYKFEEKKDEQKFIDDLYKKVKEIKPEKPERIEELIENEKKEREKKIEKWRTSVEQIISQLDKVIENIDRPDFEKITGQDKKVFLSMKKRFNTGGPYYKTDKFKLVNALDALGVEKKLVIEKEVLAPIKKFEKPPEKKLPLDPRLFPKMKKRLEEEAKIPKQEEEEEKKWQAITPEQREQYKKYKEEQEKKFLEEERGKYKRTFESNFRHFLSLYKTYDLIDSLKKFAVAISPISSIRSIVKDPYKKLPVKIKRKKTPEKGFEEMLEKKVINITAALAIGDITQRYYNTINDAKYALQIAIASKDTRNLQIQQDSTGQFIIRETKAAKENKMKKEAFKQMEAGEALNYLKSFLTLSKDSKKIEEGSQLLLNAKNALRMAGIGIKGFDKVIGDYEKGKDISTLIDKGTSYLAEKLGETLVSEEEKYFEKERIPGLSEEEEVRGRGEYQRELEETYDPEEGEAFMPETAGSILPRKISKKLNKKKVISKRKERRKDIKTIGPASGIPLGEEPEKKYLRKQKPVKKSSMRRQRRMS